MNVKDKSHKIFPFFYDLIELTKKLFIIYYDLQLRPSLLTI